MESDGYDLVSGLMDSIPANGMRRTGEIVRKATTGVRRPGIRTSVLNKISFAEEEGSDYPGSLMSGQRVDKRSVRIVGRGGEQGRDS